MDKKASFDKNIGERIAHFRKQLNLTQFELAENLNYSDKTISKWELGQSLPSIFVLNELAFFFGIPLDLLIGNQPLTTKVRAKQTRFKFAFLYSLLVFLLFFIAFGVLFIITEPQNFQTWSLILWGIAGASIPIFVYSLVYKKQCFTYISATVFVWMLTSGLFTLLNAFQNNNRLYMLFIIAIPTNLFLIILLYFIYNHTGKKIVIKNQ